MNAADNLVSLFPDRISQLNSPVFAYLSRLMPFNGKEQDLYLGVFYPAYRKKSPYEPFPSLVTSQNPGISTPQDYVDLVNRAGVTTLKADEKKALDILASKLRVPADSLNKLITFESRWNPLSKNSYTGARGLIQFMPSTAASFGYPAYVAPADVTKVDTKPVQPTPPAKSSGVVKAEFILPALVVLGAGWYVYSRYRQSRGTSSAPEGV